MVWVRECENSLEKQKDCCGSWSLGYLKSHLRKQKNDRPIYTWHILGWPCSLSSFFLVLILFPRDPGSPKLRMVFWNLNTMRFGGDCTPQSSAENMTNDA